MYFLKSSNVHLRSYAQELGFISNDHSYKIYLDESGLGGTKVVKGAYEGKGTGGGI